MTARFSTPKARPSRSANGAASAEENVPRAAGSTQFENRISIAACSGTSSFPWFPKYVGGGTADPPFAMVNWKPAGDDEDGKGRRLFPRFRPTSSPMFRTPPGLWPFALDNGIGLTWAFGQYWPRPIAPTSRIPHPTASPASGKTASPICAAPTSPRTRCSWRSS